MKSLSLKIILISIFLFAGYESGWAQKDDSDKKSEVAIKPFIAYEFGEAAFNKFRSLSGEIGIRFPNYHILRLVHMNVKLSEEHLSSSFAAAVDGPNVEGSFFGFELFYDHPVFRNILYIGPSFGYYRNEYRHTILDESIENSSPSLGFSLSLRETNIFGVGGLYYTVSFPMRFNLSSIKETSLGETTIVDSTFDNNIWLFIGYEF